MMWKSKDRQDTGTRRHGDAEKNPLVGTAASSCFRVSASPRLRVFFLLILLSLAIGCRRDMHDQPKMKPFRGTSFFGDGLSARQPIEGTIPRGFLRADTHFYTGKKSRSLPGAAPGTQPLANVPTGQNPYPDDVETFPFPITKETVDRGRERYDIFCSLCHGLTGNGDGMIVRRGFRRAASFNDDRLRNVPVGHFFDAITNGWGAMPSYAAQIPVQDRWAIIAYVRALQLSQQNTKAAAVIPASPSPTPTSGGHK